MAKKSSAKTKKKKLRVLHIVPPGEDIDAFNKLMEGLREYDRKILEYISKCLPLPRAKFYQETRTRDGKEWYAGLEFMVGEARLAIFFPWADAKQGKEYPISVYTDREVPRTQIKQTLEMFARAYERLNPKVSPA